MDLPLIRLVSHTIISNQIKPEENDQIEPEENDQIKPEENNTVEPKKNKPVEPEENGRIILSKIEIKRINNDVYKKALNIILPNKNDCNENFNVPTNSSLYR